ncbi:MAG TPA: ABC transporter permease [Gemmatimonadales bacterium]
MLLGEIFRVALDALRANKLRSLLTMLGIIIGVGAVITMVALGAGAQQAIEDRIQALGPTLLSVLNGQDFRGGVAVSNAAALTYADDTALAHHARFLAAVVPELEREQQIQFGGLNISEGVIGTTPDFITVRNYTIAAGRMFTPGDDASRQRYAVLESDIPDLFKTNGAAMIGQTIKIRGIEFEVLGVLVAKGTQGFGSSDDDILIPLETARYRVVGSDRLRQITIRAASPDSIPLAMIEIERVLRRQHKLRPGQDDNFRIRSARDVLSTLEQTTETFKYLLAGVAAVSLLVGGIGIMNIMLVSVTERTREIGVRKALGATRANILLQFVVEAVVLCIAGGVIGILGGSLGALALSRLMHWNTLISPAAVLLAFCFSAAIGLFFGIWPAQQAAALDPIQALRYE